jgi:hypothetical protein
MILYTKVTSVLIRRSSKLPSPDSSRISSQVSVVVETFGGITLS